MKKKKSNIMCGEFHFYEFIEREEKKVSKNLTSVFFSFIGVYSFKNVKSTQPEFR